MPELPEVETVVRDLRPLLVGRRIKMVRAGKKKLRRAWAPRWSRTLPGCRFESLERRGKWIVARLDGGSLLVFHLGMTGQLTVRESANQAEDHTHLAFLLDDGRQELRFRDIRRFGSASLFDEISAWEAFLRSSKLGPEPFDIDEKYWKESLERSDRNLKALLLDQRLVAGVGNIYADEGLFAAKLNPQRKGRDLAATEARRLRKGVVAVLTRAIDARGSSIRNYVGGSGLLGGYQEKLFVYGRAGQACRRCGTPIERIRLAGRSTHYCPQCQE